MADNSLVFPQHIHMNDFDGNFKAYFLAVYEIFLDCFVRKGCAYHGTKVTAQKHPEVDGIHRTFYHITHEGEDEQNRIPDLERMARIRYPHFVITSCPHDELLVWEKTVGRDERIHILNEAESYIVVLTKRRGYLLFWTAFYIQQKHTMRKKKKEYEAYINANTA